MVISTHHGIEFPGEYKRCLDLRELKIMKKMISKTITGILDF